MRNLIYLLGSAVLILLLLSQCNSGLPGASEFSAEEVARWKETASRITIIRDKWGIPHIYGPTDADAVFGMMYAQCEDDFLRIETNYLAALGRMAELEGPAALYKDLRQHLFVDQATIRKLYESAPEAMKKNMEAFAGGINYFLYTHPEVKPGVLTRFEPWMPLAFSEGSIGGDIESVSVPALRAFYEGAGSEITSGAQNKEPHASSGVSAAGWLGEEEPSGSNGFAIAPANSATGHALLLINPHTSFFFRTEQHVVSGEGLNAYGAVTWGQFFIYQGFNEHCGWMHTSSKADAIDEFAETIVEKDGKYFYKYGDEQRPLARKIAELKYKDGPDWKMQPYFVYQTHHGPVVRKQGNKWITTALMNNPLDALTQSFMRTKASSFKAFNDNMRLRTNSSNNTVYADADGNIAYYHGNFMPVRNAHFDYSGVVDGSNPATDWKGLHSIEELVFLLNPSTGWLQNCNSTPFSAAGKESPDAHNYPTYMAPEEENARGLHAVRVLEGQDDLTLDRLIEAAYDPYLVGFENLIPSLVEAYEGSTQKLALPDGIMKQLKEWDLRFSEESVPTSVAIFWAEEVMRKVREEDGVKLSQLALIDYMTTDVSPAAKLEALQVAVNKLERDFSTWQTPWGEINRFQRVEGAMREAFNDSLPSIPIGFTASMWGSLSAYGSRPYPGTSRWYGTVGNSFVAVIEFGDSLSAKAIVTGGQSSNPISPHFYDQAEMYRRAQFRKVLFYKPDIEKNAERSYHPG